MLYMTNKIFATSKMYFPLCKLLIANPIVNSDAVTSGIKSNIPFQKIMVVNIYNAKNIDKYG